MYEKSFDPGTEPKSALSYPEGNINLRVVAEKDDAVYKVRTGMNAAAWYSTFGIKIVSDGPASYAPSDVKNLRVNNMDAKSAQSVTTETDEILFILHNASLYEIYLYPYGSSSDATVKQMLNSFKIL